MKTGNDLDILLIDRILRGETPAYRDLVNRHKDYAFTIAYRLLNSREDAEEAAQDAFVRAFNGLQNFNHTVYSANPVKSEVTCQMFEPT